MCVQSSEQIAEELRLAKAERRLSLNEMDDENMAAALQAKVGGGM